MAAPQKPVTSPDISVLSFSVAYDISGPAPTLTLTNLSTVTNPTLLSWWYTVKTPSGTDVHAGTQTSPDVNHLAWTTLALPANAWPAIFGLNPPCAQIEFSPSSPYICTLYVVDSANNVFSLSIQTLITRPNGNTGNSCGNFGVAAVNVSVYCNTNKILCTESTNVAYQNILIPTVDSNSWTLTYPPDTQGNVPSPATASNTPYVNFNTGYSGDGYTVFLQHYATYDIGNGSSVKVQYKAINPNSGGAGIPFAVLCNIDLCKLQCQINTFYEQTKQKCGNVVDPATATKMTRMNLLFGEVLMGLMQPLCGIDVPALIKEIQKVGDLDENCDCGCKDGGNNFSYPLGPGGSGSGGCCPSSANILDIATDAPPAPCPQSYFPAAVYDPTGATVIGTAVDISGLVAILNSNNAWAAYGTAFAEGNCKIGWFTINPATTPPPVKVAITKVGNLVKKGTTTPPTGCPTGNPYPLSVYDTTGTTIIGVANSIAEVVAILNANSAWHAYGTASVRDTCHVGWVLNDPNVVPPNIQTDPGTTTGKLVTVGGTTPPTGCPTGNPYPLRVYDPTGTTILGIAYNISDVVTLLNGNSAWQAYGTASTIDNCTVSWTLTNPANVPPPIPVDATISGSGCVNGTSIYTVKMNDLCLPNNPISFGQLPANGWVDFGTGLGLQFLGYSLATTAAVVAALNAASGKPASITFSVGGGPGIADIIITNTNCVAYSGTPLIYMDIGSSSKLVVGASHTKMNPTTPSTGRLEAAAVRTMGVLGMIPAGIPSDGVPWHTIKIGNTVITADAKNGIVWYYDYTNPLSPTLIRTITLTNPSGNSFAMTPTMTGVGGATGTPPHFTLHFPTNPRLMTLNAHYLVEGITGTIWKLDMTDPGSGVTDAFVDQRLLGKIPRCIVPVRSAEATLFFTQDGTLEQDASLASGVTRGNVVTLLLSTFNAGGLLATTNIIAGGLEYVFAADTDGTRNIYFVGKQGTIVKYDFVTPAILGTYSGTQGMQNDINFRAFALLKANFLYVCSLSGFLPTLSNSGIMAIDLTSLGSIPLTKFLFVGLSGSGNITPSFRAFSITDTGSSCLLMVAGDNGSFAGGGALLLYKTDGSQMGMIQLPTGVNIFNVVAIPNVAVYTPNSYT